MSSREAVVPLTGQNGPQDVQTSTRRFPPLRVVPFLSDAHRALLRKTICKRLDDDQASYFFAFVERTQLDVFTGQFRPDIRQTRDSEGVKHPTLLIIVTVQGLRGNAERTLGSDGITLLDGEDPIEWADKDGNWHKAWLLPGNPAAARARVYRKDFSRPAEVVCLWEAFCQNRFDRGGNEVPNPFWKRMGPLMLGKCAIAACYRALFPNQLAGLYIQEELKDELDDDSEIAVEAEMLRRAHAEQERAERAKTEGYPVGTAVEPAPVKNDKKSRKPPQPEPPAAPEPLLTVPVPPPPPPQPPPPPVVDALREAPLVEMAAPPAPVVSNAESKPWFHYKITRISALAGRTIGSLSRAEVRAAQANWMSRVEKSWGNVDTDIQEHYIMLQQRIEHDAVIDMAAIAAATDLSEEQRRAAMDDQLNAEFPF